MHRSPRARVRTLGAIIGVAVLLAVAAPLSASAHVSLETNTAAAGSYTKLTFRVPNETVSASTDKVTITLPSDKTLFASVSFIPVAGWTAQLVVTPLPSPITAGDDTVTQAVTQVVWTADPGSEYGQGSLGIFQLFVGPVPDVGELKLPVDQSYSDGSVVSWSGSTDADHPAPVLYVNDAPVVDHDADSAPVASVEASGDGAASGGPDVVARLLGGVGLVLGAVALVIAIVGRRARTAATDREE